MGSERGFKYLRYMLGYVVLAFMAYFLFRFIMGFVVPVVRTVSQMKRKVREMNDPYGRRSGASSTYGPNPFAQRGGNGQNTSQVRVEIKGDRKGPFSRFSKQKKAAGNAKPSKSDYIEFEEIK